MRSTFGSVALFVLAGVAALAFGSALAVAGDTTSTSPQIRSGGTLTIGLAEDPDALDPTIARTFVGRIVFLHMCEKLYDLDSHLNIVPQLASALPQISKDKLTYVIKIRSGIKFNDGSTLDGAAVKTTLDRYLTFKGSTRKSEISPISSVDAAGNTVTLHLSTPYSPLTAQLADRAGMILSPEGARRGCQLRAEPGLRRPLHVQGSRRGRPHHARQVAALLRRQEGASRDDHLPDHDRPERPHAGAPRG